MDSNRLWCLVSNIRDRIKDAREMKNDVGDGVAIDRLIDAVDELTDLVDELGQEQSQ